jgi:hypothetical protein
LRSASHAARCTATHGVAPAEKPSALVMGWLWKLATQPVSTATLRRLTV